jgi:serine protease Do
VEALRGQVAGLADALRTSQSQVQGLQSQLTAAQATGDHQQIAQLRRQLDDASVVFRNQQVAAQVDFTAIYQANQRAVGMVYVRFENGGVFTGTAFAVRSDGTMLTNKHVVRGKDGTQTPRDIGVQFADSRQFFQAQVLAVSNEVDLAVIRVSVGGPVPAVKGLSGTAQPGDPVAVIGFPLGLDLPMQSAGEGRPIVKTSLNAGTVSKVLPDRIQFDGYGAEGASGSPIFDRNGEVMAVLFGGEPGTSGRVVYGVPVSFVTRLLQQVN